MGMFYLNKEGDVEFQLKPAIPSWLFVDEETAGDAILDDDGQYTVSSKLFGTIPVIYHNPDGNNLYGNPPISYRIVLEDGSVEDVEGEFVPNELALKIRRTTEVVSIDAFF